jgi:hypothetical protein
MTCLSEQILAIREDRTVWPPEVVPSLERGIVMTGCGRLFRHIWANITHIRRGGFADGIDVWHLPGEFNEKQIAALNQIANVVEAGNSPFSGLSGTHEVHGFKAWMLSQSRFAKTLMLDVNSFPLQSLDPVFACDRTCILWQDGPWRGCLGKISELRRNLSIPLYSFEFESGQLFIDRSTLPMRDGVRLAAALNALGKQLYRATYGDKETYSIAFDLLEKAFTIAPPPIVYPTKSEHRYAGLIQPWLDGSALFYHPMDAKDHWWKFRKEWRALFQDCETIARSLE